MIVFAAYKASHCARPIFHQKPAGYVAAEKLRDFARIFRLFCGRIFSQIFLSVQFDLWWPLEGLGVGVAESLVKTLHKKNKQK